jgi:hypothetical protein
MKGGGAHRRRHWPDDRRQRPIHLVHLSNEEGTVKDWCGWGESFSTLLSPEGTTVRLYFGERNARHGLATYTAKRCLGWCDAGGVVGWLFVENCTVDASILFSVGQVVKGERWMPWHQEPMKDVGGDDTPGGAVNRAVIPGFPNGGTRHQSCGVTHT